MRARKAALDHQSIIRMCGCLKYGHGQSARAHVRISQRTVIVFKACYIAI